MLEKLWETCLKNLHRHECATGRNEHYRKIFSVFREYSRSCEQNVSKNLHDNFYCADFSDRNKDHIVGN